MIVRVPLKLGQKLLRIPFHLTRSLRDLLLRRIETVLKAKFPAHLNNTYSTLKTQKECHFIIADLLLELTKSMHKQVEGQLLVSFRIRLKYFFIKILYRKEVRMREAQCAFHKTDLQILRYLQKNLQASLSQAVAKYFLNHTASLFSQKTQEKTHFLFFWSTNQLYNTVKVRVRCLVFK